MVVQLLLGETQPPCPLVSNPTKSDGGQCATPYQVGNVRKFDLMDACT